MKRSSLSLGIIGALLTVGLFFVPQTSHAATAWCANFFDDADKKTIKGVQCFTTEAECDAAGPAIMTLGAITGCSQRQDTETVYCRGSLPIGNDNLCFFYETSCSLSGLGIQGCNKATLGQAFKNTFAATTAPNPDQPGANQPGAAGSAGFGNFKYVPLEDSFISEENAQNLPKFLKFLYNTAIAIVGIAALVMMTIGGGMYITSAGNAATATTARKMITDALAGLALVLFSWLILFVINPDLVGVDENLEKLLAVAEKYKPDLGEGAAQPTPGQPTPGQPTPGQPTPTTPGPTGTCSGGNCVSLGANGIPVRLTGNVCGGTSGAGNKDCKIASSMAAKLSLLAQDNRVTGWWVTEAWPPTRNHKDPCHQAGTCVDVSFSGQAGGATAQQVRQLLESSSAVGIRAQAEVKTQAQKDALVAAGVPAEKISVLGNWITGDLHFSLYNQ